MKDLIITQTENTLGVKLSITHPVFEFVGDSRPENVKQFFEPILTWLDDYTVLKTTIQEDKKYNVMVNYKFDYFNSSSAKYIIELIKKIETINLISPISFIQQWFYETDDEDSKEAAEEFMKMTNVKLILIETANFKI